MRYVFVYAFVFLHRSPAYRTNRQCCAAHCRWTLRGWQVNRCTKDGYGGLGLRDPGFSCPIDKVHRQRSLKCLLFCVFFTMLFQMVQIKSRRDHQARSSDSKSSWLLKVRISHWAIHFRDILYLSQGRLWKSSSTRASIYFPFILRRRRR